MPMITINLNMRLVNFNSSMDSSFFFVICVGGDIFLKFDSCRNYFDSNKKKFHGKKIENLLRNELKF